MRAADGDRTRDFDLGKVALYHLSYRRTRAWQAICQSRFS